jgi:hypothetical protein
MGDAGDFDNPPFQEGGTWDDGPDQGRMAKETAKEGQIAVTERFSWRNHCFPGQP